MRHWLMKSEPDVFSILDLERMGSSPWDGVRNFQARNYMRQMAVGDAVLFYHSNAKPSGIAGLAQVSRLAYPDPTAWEDGNPHFDPRSTPERPLWDMVEVKHVATWGQVLSLETLRKVPDLLGMALLQKGSRLSVMPVAPHEFDTLMRLHQNLEG